jgi:hypothetical protein
MRKDLYIGLRRLVLVAALVAVAAGAQTSNGPFGLRMGQKLSETNVQDTISDSYFSIKVPLPNNMFKMYGATIAPDAGLCHIIAISESNDNDRYGAQTKIQFEDLRLALTEKYGSSVNVDRLKSGALWDAPSEWVMSVRQNERVVAAFWTRDKGANLPPEIDRIQVHVSASSMDSSGVTLAYWFANYSVCDSEIKKKANSNL